MVVTRYKERFLFVSGLTITLILLGVALIAYVSERRKREFLSERLYENMKLEWQIADSLVRDRKDDFLVRIVALLHYNVAENDMVLERIHPKWKLYVKAASRNAAGFIEKAPLKKQALRLGILDNRGGTEAAEETSRSECQKRSTVSSD